MCCRSVMEGDVCQELDEWKEVVKKHKGVEEGIR